MWLIGAEPGRIGDFWDVMQDGGGDMRGSDDSVVLHPTPCATTEAPDITQYHPESFMGDVDRCCLHQASQGSESVPVDMRSPSLMDAAPSDGMLVVRAVH